MASIAGYRIEIGLLQLAHLPLSINQLIIGIFCQGLMAVLHLGQVELGFTRLKCSLVFFGLA